MTVEQRYESAKEQYRAIGVDTDAAIEKLKNVAISMHCWQGDDVTGFDHDGPAVWRHSGNRQISGQGEDTEGTDGRYGQGAFSDSRQTQDQSACKLCDF